MRACLHIGLVLLALTPSAYLAWTFRDMPYMGAFGDDAVYWVDAKSLAEGAGYRVLSLPSQPFETKHPPLYSLVLSLIWKVNPSFPDNLRLAFLAAWIMLPSYVLAAGWLLREMGAGRTQNALLCCALALNMYPVLCSLTFLSDLMFSALVVACCIVTDRALLPPRRPRMVLAAGALAGFAYLTKSAGIAVVVAGLLVFLLRRHYGRAAHFACGMLPAVVGWNVWRVFHAPSTLDGVPAFYTSYLSQTLAFRELPSVIWTNFKVLWIKAAALIVVKPGDELWVTITWGLILGLAIVGVLRMARSRLTAYHCFALAYVCLLLVWNYPPTERLLIPLQPLLLAGLGYEISRIVRFVRRRLQSLQGPGALVEPVLALGLVIVSLFALASTSIMIAQTFRWFTTSRRELAQTRRAYEWIDANLPENASFVAYDDSVFYLYTHRHACGVGLSTERFYRRNAETVDECLRSLRDYARRNGLSHLLLTPNFFAREFTSEAARQQALRTVREQLGRSLLYDSPAGAVFRIF